MLLGLLDLPLDELTTISVASKREESIDVAPAIVAVVTAEDIRRYGYNTLCDILNRQPHLQVVGSNLFPHNKSVVRGVNTSHIENNILLQLNGRPMREATLSSLSLDIYSLFPVSSIKKIEIIRGPGSVLYGTNAFSGVVNIVTYSGDDNKKGQANVGVGQNQTRSTEANGSFVSEGMEVFAAINHFATEGDSVANITDQFGQVDKYPMGLHGTQGLMRFDFGGFTANTLLSRSSTDNVRSLFAFPATDIELDRIFLDLEYRYEIDQNWDLIANYTHTKVESLLTVLPDPSPPPTPGRSNNRLYEILLRGQLTKKIRFVAGLNYEAVAGKGDTVYTSYSHRVYSQMDFQAAPWLKLVAGAQFNYSDAADDEVSPRLGVVARLNKRWHVKLLYSSAFREASPLERFISVPSIMGDPNLNAETIDTIDLQFRYEKGKNQFALTLFESQQKNLITRRNGFPIQIINGGDITYQGLELEAKKHLSSNWEFIANTSYQTNKSDFGNDTTYAPDLMFKGGVSYSQAYQWNAGLFINYFAESTLQNDPQTSTYANPDADAYTLVTVNVHGNLGWLLGRKYLSPFSATFYIDNLLDQKIFFPSINRQEVNSIPHHARRGIYLKLEAQF